MSMARNLGMVMAIVVLAMGLTMWAPGSSAEDAAAAPASTGATGTWKYSFEGFNGTVEVVIKLVQEGEKLTGTVTGFDGSEDAILEGAVNGDAITFKIVRDFGDQMAVTTYSGTVSGDSLKGKTETVFVRDFEATRAGA